MKCLVSEVNDPTAAGIDCLQAVGPEASVY